MEEAGNARIPATASLVEIATQRLCSDPSDGDEPCRMQLLCAMCGRAGGPEIERVCRQQPQQLQQPETVAGSGSAAEQLDCLKFSGRGGTCLVMTPAVVVIDAVSVIRASQRAAVVPGAGLTNPIRPLQGPVCSACRTGGGGGGAGGGGGGGGGAAGGGGGGFSGPDGERDDCPLLPSDTVSESDPLETRHVGLLREMQALRLTPSLACPGAGTGVVLSTPCACAARLAAPCTNGHASTMQKQSMHSSATARPPLCIVFGHAAPPPACEPAAGVRAPVSSSSIRGSAVDPAAAVHGSYEIWIVDSRAHHMCRLMADGCVRRGVVGQSFYTNNTYACAPAPAPASTALSPPHRSSCFVCCTLLEPDDDGHDCVVAPAGCGMLKKKPRLHGRDAGVYLAGHRQWAHAECTVACESRVSPLCQRDCPRLNTSVSTVFDHSPRFENVCAACLQAKGRPSAGGPRATPRPASSSSSQSQSPLRCDMLEPAASTTATHRREGDRATSGKRTPGANWLSAEASMRKRAAVNAAKQRMTPKERQAAASSQMQFPVDKGGVFLDKKNGCWYTLDSEGENRGPVCGQPYWDPFFGERRTWDTIGERTRAILAAEEDAAATHDV